MFIIKRRQRQNTWCSSLFPKKAFLRWETFLDALASLDFKLSVSQSLSDWYLLQLAHLRVFQVYFLIKSSLTAGKVVFLSVSCEIFWKLCFSYWVLLLNSKFRKVKVVCSDKVLMIFWCWVLIAFPILSSFEPREVSAEPLFLVSTFDTRVRLTVLRWATYLWCTKWRLILDFFSFFSIWICFVPGFISRVFLSSYVCI